MSYLNNRSKDQLDTDNPKRDERLNKLRNKRLTKTHIKTLRDLKSLRR